MERAGYECCRRALHRGLLARETAGLHSGRRQARLQGRATNAATCARLCSLRRLVLVARAAHDRSAIHSNARMMVTVVPMTHRYCRVPVFSRGVVRGTNISTPRQARRLRWTPTPQD
jgi:hypothetical protein